MSSFKVPNIFPLFTKKNKITVESYIYIYTRHFKPHALKPTLKPPFTFSSLLLCPPSLHLSILLNLGFLPQETQFPISPLFSYQEFVIFCPRSSTAPHLSYHSLSLSGIICDFLAKKLHSPISSLFHSLKLPKAFPQVDIFQPRNLAFDKEIKDDGG